MFTYTIVILILALVLGAITIFLVNKYPKSRGVLQLGYGAVVVALALLMIARIMQPINFKKERKLRTGNERGNVHFETGRYSEGVSGSHRYAGGTAGMY